ncbi:MAG: hypothetical protein HY704_14930 [Gemmatimonadetes bacterium]|nr:hypothetical protein [Gemmatimonadota bacterium]
MRVFGELFLAGLAGLVALKLAGALILPLFGMLFGLVTLLIKLLVFGAIAYFVYSLLRRRRANDAVA